jgi:Nif-specific regulatory protein
MEPGEFTRLARERDLYLRILRLGGVDAIEPLLREALALVVEITGALQAYVEISDPRGDDETPGWWLAHDCTSDELVDIRARISRGVIAQALAGGRTVETTSALLDERFRERASVRIGHIEAVLCTPIGAHPPIGVVYLHGGRRECGFTADAREKVELLAFHLAPLADRLVARHREDRERDPTRLPRASLRADAVVGRSDAVATALRQVGLFAPLEVPVLIAGPAGSGRRLLARVLHENSGRAGKPIVEIACREGAPESLDVLLFGDGLAAAGRLLEAAGGSVLLRDVEALPLSIQSRLLGLLETGCYRCLDDRRIATDIRLLATTDADLEDAARAGRFREDLLRRLQTLCIRVPSLAERPTDVEELARFFCARSCERQRAPRLELSLRALRSLEASEWPRNVAQLEATVEKAVESALREGVRKVESRHLFPRAGRHASECESHTFQDATREFQKDLLRRVLDETHWNVSAAARRLDLTRSHVYNLISAFALTRAPS